MLTRWLVCLGAWILQPLSSSATELPTQRCGFQPAGPRITDRTAGVPLVLAPASLPGPSLRRIQERRARLVEQEQSCAERHPETVRYLQAILERLIVGSHLESFAGEAPSVKLVLTCSRPVPLPVAHATAGNMLLVPRALPERAGSEDAIAAVLGHELAHLTLRHPEQLIGAATRAQLDRAAARELKREHERQADIAGLRLAVNAGYDARAALDHLQSVERLATRLERSGRLRRRGPGLHGALSTRTRLLQSQIDACGYTYTSARKPVAPAVREELMRPAASVLRVRR